MAHKGKNNKGKAFNSEARSNMESGEKYDVIVIGTGMGGSACGAILAKHGFKVLILEKNPRVGGSCSYYEKEGFKVDMGTHMFIRGNKGPFGECTRRLGMGTPLKFVRTPGLAWVRGFNVDACMPASYARMPPFLLRSLIQAEVPVKKIPSITRFFIDTMRMSEEKIEEWNERTVEDYISLYTDDPFLHSIMGYLISLYFILPSWQSSAGEAIWNFQHFVRDKSLGYPKGGAVVIPQTFLEGAEMHGAQVLTDTPVEKIIMENGGVAGVVSEGNAKFYAPVVVSTTALEDTVRKLVGRDYFPSSYAKMAESIKSSYIAVQAKIGLKKKVTEVGCVCGSYPFKVPRDNITPDSMREKFQLVEKGIHPENTAIYCPIPSNFDPDLAPPGMQLLTGCSVAPTTDIELQDPPQVWIDNMLTALYEMVPNAKENVLFEDTFTVDAIASWIGKSSGAAVTTGQTPDQVGDKRPGYRTPIKGLYVCGDGAGARGVGTELACQSGMECADLINLENTRG